MKEFGGDEDYTFEYIEPQPGENDAMKDTLKRKEVIAKQQALADELQEATKQWIEAAKSNDEAGVQSWKTKREELASNFAKGYWEADPYIRARSQYDRNGVILGGGKTSFYLEQDSKDTTAVATAAETEKKTEVAVNGVEAANPAVAVSAT